MSRLIDSFTRFPHRCVVYAMGNPTGFETEKEINALRKVVWEGRCRKESNTSIRTFFGSDHVIKGDYRVQLGSLVGGPLPGDNDAAQDGVYGEECGAVPSGIKSGLYVDVYERDVVEQWEGERIASKTTSSSGSSSSSSSSSDEEVEPSCILSLNDAYVGNLGTTLYCDEYKT